MTRAAWQALVWTVIVALLTAAVVLTDRRPIATGRAVLVPGLDARAVTAIELARPGEPIVTIAIGATGARVTAPSPGAADPVAVRDLVSAIATARADRWQRGAAAWRGAGLDRAPLTVRVTSPAGDATIVVGAAVDAAGQRWIGRPPDRAALVPSWVARALDRRVDQLRVRAIVTTARPTGVELHGPGVDLVLAGAALVRRDDGASVRLAPALRVELVAALAALTFVRFDDGPRADPLGTIRVLGGNAVVELAWFGPCPGALDDAVQIEASVGVGCVASAALDAVRAIAARATTPAAISAQPLDGTAPLARIAIGDTLDVVRHGATWAIGSGGLERPADPAAVDAVEAALASAATIAPLIDDPARAERWQVTTTDGETQRWQVWRTADRVAIRRGDEPFVLTLGSAAAALARTVGPALRDRALVRLDPLRVASITATGAAPAVVARGELVGEWLVTAPAGAAITPAAEALSAWLGQLRVDRWSDAAALGAVRRTLTVTSDPPPGAGTSAPVDTLRIGARIVGGGCWVAIDGTAAAALGEPACARLLAPLATRHRRSAGDPRQ